MNEMNEDDKLFLHYLILWVGCFLSYIEPLVVIPLIVCLFIYFIKICLKQNKKVMNDEKINNR